MAVQVLERVMGRKPYFVRIGGTIPAAALIKSILGIDITMFAFGCASEQIVPVECLACLFASCATTAPITVLGLVLKDCEF